MSNSQSYQGIPGAYRRSVILKSILIFGAGLLVTTAVLYLTVRQPIGPSYGEGFRMLAQLQNEIFYKSAIIYAITSLFILCGIIFLTLIYSHRVAGPVYRLSCYVKELGSGDFRSPVHIREKDVIHPIADEMNTMLEGYQQTLKNIKDEVQGLEQYAEKISEGLATDDSVWTDIEKRAGKIAAELERYKL